MREIKFRAWDKKSKKMRQVTEIVFNTGFYLEPDDNTVKLIWVKGQDIIENKEIQLKRENDFILMQYTGLKDKDGKEIYEGDYIEYETEGEIYGKGIVKYSEKYAQYVLVGTGTAKDEFEPLGDYNMEVYEVRGNIYDNPELLEV